MSRGQSGAMTRYFDHHRIFAAVAIGLLILALPAAPAQAAGEGGFKGIGPNFDRSGLLNFGGGGACEIAFERTDTGKRVETAFNASMVPMADEARMLLGRLIAGQASSGESARFGELWQDRVRRLMIDHGDDPALVAIRLC